MENKEKKQMLTTELTKEKSGGSAGMIQDMSINGIKLQVFQNGTGGPVIFWGSEFNYKSTIGFFCDWRSDYLYSFIYFGSYLIEKKENEIFITGKAKQLLSLVLSIGSLIEYCLP